MNRLHEWIGDLADGLLPLLTTATFKGSIVLLSAGLVCLLLRRNSAAVRHHIWATSIVLTLALPALAIALPHWQVLPGWTTVERPTPTLEQSIERPEPIEIAELPRSVSAPQHDADFELSIGELTAPPPATPIPAAAIEKQDHPVQSAIVTQAAAAPVSPHRTRTALSILTSVWLAGCAAAFCRLVLAILALHRSARRCRLLDDDSNSPREQDLRRALDQGALRLGISRRVALLLDSQDSMPVVWGLWRVNLRLPADAIDWNSEQRNSVLLHELAHVRRRDLPILAATQWVAAINWFNPLFWLAAWRLHVERERACDDLVLEAGVKPSLYAGHLLQFVDQLRSVSWLQVCGLAMARKSSLETRLSAILSQQINRHRPTRRLVTLSALIGCLSAIPLAMLQANHQKPAPAASTKPGTPAAGDEKPKEELVDDSLFVGEWEGENKEVKIELDFPRKTKFQQAHWSINRLNGNDRGVVEHDLEIDVAADRKSAKFVFHSKNDSLIATVGRVVRGPNNTFVVDVVPDPKAAANPPLPAVKGLVLKARTPKKSSAGRPLPAGLEDQLQWGAEVNGLQAALVLPPALGEPASKEIFDFRLVVRNVSSSPIKFRRCSDDKSRMLLRKQGRILAGFGDSEATPVDYLLQPGEIAILRLFGLVQEGESMSRDPGLTFQGELPINNAPDAYWKGKLVTGDMAAAACADGLAPKKKYSRELFKHWSESARFSGNIPGGFIERLAQSITTFTKNNPTNDGTPGLLAMLSKLDGQRDWTGREAIELLDEVASHHDLPIEMALENDRLHTVHSGAPLPAEFAKAPWGGMLPTGLRMAWLFEPRADQYHLKTTLKSRVIIHNAGKVTIAFPMKSFQQPGIDAFLVSGRPVTIEQRHWLTLGRQGIYRLRPGEFVELYVPGICLGKNETEDDWQNARAGELLDVEADDEVEVTPHPIQLTNNQEDPGEGMRDGWWQDFIRARLARLAPFPDDRNERERLLYLIAMELFGNPVAQVENDAFVADHSDEALDNLAERLAHRAGIRIYEGTLQSGSSLFRVLPEDVDSAKRPRVVTSSGWYTVSDLVRLSVASEAGDDGVVNSASLNFFSKDQKQDPPPPAYTIHLPPGFGSWKASWKHNGTTLWVSRVSFGKTEIVAIDFSNPKEVKETPVGMQRLPEDIQRALRGTNGK